MNVRLASLVTMLFLTADCSRPQPEGVPQPEEDWVAATCDPAVPDTTGWTRHRFSDLSIAIPPGYTVSNSSTRFIQFRRGTGTLVLSVNTDMRLYDLHARPDRAKHEKVCPVMIGGFPSEILSTWYGQDFTVRVEWDGRSFWPAGDWRRSLSARITTSRVHDATILRQALWTLRSADGRRIDLR